MAHWVDNSLTTRLGKVNQFTALSLNQLDDPEVNRWVNFCLPIETAIENPAPYSPTCHVGRPKLFQHSLARTMEFTV